MASLSKKYITLGLRRDKNLSDVSNARTSLNNLLDNLVSTEGESFISEDLDAIRGIKNTNINVDKISGVAGIAVVYSEIDNGLTTFSVDSISSNGANQSTITVNTTTAHGLFTGNTIAVKNAAIPAANGIFSATVTSASSFTYKLTSKVSQALLVRPVSLVSDGAAPFSTITVTMSAVHNLTTSDQISITGTAFSSTNGTFPVTVSNSTEFTFVAKGSIEAGLDAYLDTTVTSIDTKVTDTVINTFEVTPLVTIKDRVQAAKTITGDPPGISGGDGPITRFIPSAFIKSGLQTSVGNPWSAIDGTYRAWANAYFTSGNIPGNIIEFGEVRNTKAEAQADITTVIYNLQYRIGSYQDVGEVTYDLTTGVHTFDSDGIFEFTQDQVQEVFWDNGYFSFPAIMDKSFDDQYGGIQWEGYFSPQPFDASVSIAFNTTGLFMFEVDKNDDGNWETLKSWYAATRDLTVTAGSGTNVITLAAGQNKFIGVGDIVGSNPDVELPIVVNSISGNDVTLSDVYTLPVPGVLTVTKKLGQTYTYGSVTIPSVEIGDMTKIRMSLWFPNDGSDIFAKAIEFSYIGTDLTFNYIYSVKPTAEPGPNEIRTFLADALAPAQPLLGTYQNNKKFYLNNSFISLYSPVSGLASIKKIGPVSTVFQASNRVITAASALTNVEVGNYIVPTVASTLTKINYPLQVWASIGSTVKVASRALGSDFTEAVTFVENKGLISWFYATSSGTEVTLTGPFITITAITFGTITTISTGTVKHQFEAGQRVTITGAAHAGFNVTWKIASIINEYTFTISYNSSSVTPAYVANSAKVTPFNTSRIRNGNIIVYRNTAVVTSITKGATTTITSTGHGFSAGNIITISGATGFTNINGTWTIQSAATNTFTINLNSSALSGTYTASSAKINDYVRVTAVTSPLSLTTNVPLYLTGEQVIYAYTNQSLVDASKDVFCNGVFGQVLDVTVSSGNTLVLRSVDGVAVNQVIQFGNAFLNGTTVTNVDTNTKTITISQAIQQQVKASSTLVFAPAGTTLNKESCVIPLDTAPPFVGSAKGLSTSGKGIKSTAAVSTFALVANKISATIPSTNIILSTLTILSIVKGTTTTINTTTSHGYLANTSIVITGATGFASLNGTWTIQVVNSDTQFTINLNSSALSGTYAANTGKINDTARFDRKIAIKNSSNTYSILGRKV